MQNLRELGKSYKKTWGTKKTPPYARPTSLRQLGKTYIGWQGTRRHAHNTTYQHQINFGKFTLNDKDKIVVSATSF